MTDCIRRSDVHDIFATWLSDYLTDDTREALETIEAKIADLPSVEPKNDTLHKNIEYGTDGNLYEMSISNGKEYEGAIKALKQEHCEDCISIKDAINAIYGLHTGGKEAVEQESVFDHYSEALHDAVYAIEELPPVKPTRAKGKWEYVQYDGNKAIGNWHCSECRLISNADYHFCPNCGADMRGDEE